MIYLDNAATTAMREECVEKLQKYYCGKFFNPSAPYKPASDITKMMKTTKEALMSYMHAPEGSIVFTGSGTEADNIALLGTLRGKKNKIIISAGEHSAVFNTAQHILSLGHEVAIAPVKPTGEVIMSELEGLLDKDVTLVSIMHVNNETGAVNNIEAISKLIKEKAPNALFHSDGIQAFGKIPVHLRNAGVDLYSVSAHKLHGPKGIGALYIKKGIKVKPIIFGGGQEAGIRSATENTGAIRAFRKAAKIQFRDFDKFESKVKKIRRAYFKGLKNTFPDITINTDMENSSPYILNIAFKDVRGEVLLHALERHEIYVGIGSACSSKKTSRIKDLLGLPEDYRDGIVRLSFSDLNNLSEVDYVLEKMKKEYDILKKFKRK